MANYYTDRDNYFYNMLQKYMIICLGIVCPDTSTGHCLTMIIMMSSS